MPRSGAYLAGNIRVCRKARGLTQGELARELGLTAQTVSKWETGMAVPDLNNLCALASALQVTADWLLQERAGEAFVAIDGGGSKTEFLLLNESGRVLNRLVLESTGMSLHRYVLQRRLTVATGLLVGTRKSVSQIAAELGFHSASHFSAFFKKATGVTPAQCRKNGAL